MPKQATVQEAPKEAPKPKVDKEKIVEEYLGVHPKYLVFTANQIHVDLWNMEHDGYRFDGWKPYREKMGIK